MKYYEGFDIVANHHFEAAGYTDTRKCLFWLGVILRVHDFEKGSAFEKPALDKLYGPNWKNGFSVLMLFQRFAQDVPEMLVQKFMSAYSEEVEKVDTEEKYFHINGGYSFYGAFVHSGKTATAFTWMTAREAEKRWDLKPGTIRHSCKYGPLVKYAEQKLARKSEGTWIVSDVAMKEVYGEPKV
ncbi:hypothetical protein C0966_00855 [Bacillus methanolicus]|uniref:helix-turn-helix domain-containing protein n=1 Tax=Bacillus methanolicus TaxID=1471 RepID=UPI00238044F3|nr:helix-turn-helix domain-containing protein [Bacillus methanolicus]MDE3837956.1 hypothetical protein [Bacillus methanolicus]